MRRPYREAQGRAGAAEAGPLWPLVGADRAARAVDRRTRGGRGGARGQGAGGGAGQAEIKRLAAPRPSADPGAFAARAGRARGGLCLPSLRQHQAQPHRYRRARDLGIRAVALQGRHPRPAEAELPAVRDHHPTAAAVFADRARPPRSGAAGACAGGQICRPLSPLPPKHDLRPCRRRVGSLDHDLSGDGSSDLWQRRGQETAEGPTGRARPPPYCSPWPKPSPGTSRPVRRCTPTTRRCRCLIRADSERRSAAYGFW